MINFRVLAPEEYPRLKQMGPPTWEPPSPDNSLVTIAERDGKIVGFWCAQDVVHVEPIWVDPVERNNIVVGKMWAHLTTVLGENNVKTFYAFSPDEGISNYLERLGMQDVGWKTFRGEV